MSRKKIKREFTDYMKLESYKNMLHVMSFKYIVTEDLEEAKKNLKEYWESLPNKIRKHPHFDKAFTKLIARRT